MKGGLIFVALMGATWASAVDVYVMSSGEPGTDAAVMNALTAQGHTPTLGVEYSWLDGTASLAGYEAVYAQCNYNWANPDMPLAGQTQLARFVANGGGLILSEWCSWRMANSALQRLVALNPFQLTASYAFSIGGTFSLMTPDPVVSFGLPSSFSVVLTSYSGSNTLVFGVRPGGTEFHSFNDGLNVSVGLAGRAYGRGRVAAFSTTNGPGQFASTDFQKLVGNTVQWTSNGAGGVTVSGHVDLEGWLPSPNGVEVEVLFWQGADTVHEAPFVSLDGNGNFAIPVPLSGTYEVTVKASHWLRKRNATVAIGPGGVSGLGFSLINGDVDGNNLVDSDDFDRLVAGFGYMVGDPPFDVETDLNGTDNTDSDDFDILVANFGQQGD